MRRTGKSLSRMQLKIIRVRKKIYQLMMFGGIIRMVLNMTAICDHNEQVQRKKQGGLKLLFCFNIPFMLSPASFVILVLKNFEVLMIL